MINKVFTVLTEFRFDVQSAVAQTGVLQRSVEKISTASNQAMASLSGYAAALVGGYFSVWKIMSAAVSASEELTKSQLVLANIFSGQKNYLVGPVETFADRMLFAKQVLEDISDVAKKFSLPEAEMAGMVKMMAPVLNKAEVAGVNQAGTIDLSRKFLKAAPTLGVDPGLAQGQMVSMLTGAASLNDTLFRRLLTETDAFTKIAKAKNATDAFNKLDEKDRFKMISEGLEQFSKDMDVVQGMTGLLSSKMQLLRDRLVGIKGILVPLGESVIPILKVALDTLMQFLDTTGRKLVGSFAGLIKGSVGAPKTIWDVVDALTPMYATMKQLGSLKSDVSGAGKVAGTLGIITGIMSVMGWFVKLGRIIPGVGIVLSALYAVNKHMADSNAAIVSRAIASITKWLSIGTIIVGVLAYFGKVGLAFRIIGFAIGKIFWPLMLLTGIFQILSRAAAIAKITDIKDVFGNPAVWGRITGAIERLMTGLYRLGWPLFMISDKLARFIAPIFTLGLYINPLVTLLEALASVVGFLGDALFLAMAGFQGIVFFLMQLGTLLASNPLMVLGDFFTDFLKLLHNNVMVIVDIFRAMFLRITEMGHALLSGNFGKVADLATSPLSLGPRNILDYSDTTKSLGGAASAGIDEFISSNFGDYQAAKERMMVSNSVTNINKVEIRQDFKENQEPDRVAHSVIRALGELAKNPTQAVGRTMQGGLLSGT